MSESVITVSNLHKRFEDIHAVQGISFEVQRGQVVGFIGANGAGKTTTMRMLSSLELPDSGSIKVCGYDVVEHSEQIRGVLGWMPDSYGTYEFMSVYEYLDFFARAYGLRGAERCARIGDVMEFTDLTSLKDRYVDTLSKGMGQRLCLGRTLLHDPEVLVLDEPAAGLDPKARVEFKHLVRLLAQDGKTIFISSHILSELEDMCSTLLFIDSGRIVHHGSAEVLKRGERTTIEVEVQINGDPAKLAEWVSLNPGVKLVEQTNKGARIEISDPSSNAVADVLRRLIKDGLDVFDFHEYERKLEEAFIDIVGKIANGSAKELADTASKAEGDK